MHERIKVLFLAADPFRSGARLQLDEEIRAIDLAIRQGRERDSLVLVPQFATRTGELQDALLRHQPHVVHFAGHGDAAGGGIYLGDDFGRATAVGKEALGRLFGILGEPVRLVVLNGCATLPLAEVLSEVVDFAIGMTRPVHDDSAARFAAAFYGALAMGRGVREAFELGVNRLELEGDDDADVPALRVRAGADPAGVLLPASADHASESGSDRRSVPDTHLVDVEVGRDASIVNRAVQPGRGTVPSTRIDGLKVARDLSIRNGFG